MQRRSSRINRWQKITACLIIVVSILGIAGMFTQKAFAARGSTAYICNTRVDPVNWAPVPGTTNRWYVTYEFRIEGNDYARRFMDGSGNVQAEPGSVLLSYGTCTHDAYWDGSSFDFNNAAWRTRFDDTTKYLMQANFQSVGNVYLGMGPIGSNPAVTNDYCNNPGVGSQDPPTFFGSFRFILGIEKCSNNSTFASINDAGVTLFDNNVLWCMGMGFPIPFGPNGADYWECREAPQTGNPIDAATVYTGGGDFAGYLNATSNDGYNHARKRLNTYYSNRVINRQPINDLLGGRTNIPLRMMTQNTRDAVPPSYFPACDNSTPGVWPCYPPGLPADPLINNKASTFITFELISGPMLMGRIYQDNNGDGQWQSGEPFVQNGVDCVASPTPRVTVPNVYVTVSGISGQFPPNRCNNEPFYEAPVQVGNRSVAVNVPAGWQVTSANPVNVNFASAGGVYHQWFGIRPIALSCGGAALTSTVPEVGVPFNMTVSAAPPIAGSSGFVAIRTADNAGASLAPGTNVPPGTVSGAYDSNGQRSFNDITISQSGTYYIRWTYNTPSGTSVTCSQPLNVGERPYLKVFGNDVSAGSDFSPSGSSVCNIGNATNNKAAILSFARETAAAGGNPATSRGAGTQLANFALGEIWQNISGANQGPPGSVASSPPKGLTFGNYYSAGSTSIYGGQSGQYRCIPDYYSIVSQRIGTTPTNGGSLSGSGALTNQFYRPPSNTALNFSWTGLTTKAAVVVDGDVFIGPNGVTYNGYTSPANMPSLYLIVRGDIRISRQATNLSGVFIAQPKVDSNGNPTNEGGNIYTCVRDASSYVPPNNIGATNANTANCRAQLTVNGAFIARNMSFIRAIGTLNNSTQNETWSSGNIAELFKSSPELYLSAPDVLRRSVSPGSNYDSITSLPPIL